MCSTTCAQPHLLETAGVQPHVLNHIYSIPHALNHMCSHIRLVIYKVLGMCSTKSPKKCMWSSHVLDHISSETHVLNHMCSTTSSQKRMCSTTSAQWCIASARDLIAISISICFVMFSARRPSPENSIITASWTKSRAFVMTLSR